MNTYSCRCLTFKVPTEMLKPSIEYINDSDLFGEGKILYSLYYMACMRGLGFLPGCLSVRGED